MEEKLDRYNQGTRKWIPFAWSLILIAFICGCEGLPGKKIRPDPGSYLVVELQWEYSFRYLYEPPDSAFTTKNVASPYYKFWDGKHKPPNSDDICGTCAGEALNTGDELYSGIALLDWDRHSETYTTHLGTYADSVVRRLSVTGWDTLNWQWPPKISSAWRNPARNERIPDALDTSLHMFGRAIDFDGDNQDQLNLLFNAVYYVGGRGVKKDEPTGWMHSKFPPF